MTTSEKNIHQGSHEAPPRHPPDWKGSDFRDEGMLIRELERVFDICHGCRRCLNLCNAFPTLFDLVDESATMELGGVARQDYWNIVDHCYLCDRCDATKCPYIPPHKRNVDFPQLMLRAKAVRFRKRGAGFRDRLLASPDKVGRLATIPVVAQVINAAADSPSIRRKLHLHPDAVLPRCHRTTLRKRRRELVSSAPAATTAADAGVVLFATCYGNFNEPELGDDLVAVFEHNSIPVALAEEERCCGFLRLELGDLDAVEQAREVNIPQLAEWVDRGWNIVVPLPTCVLMFRQWLPLMFPDDALVRKVRNAIFDPFEYLMQHHKEGRLKTGFKRSLGVVLYHLSCRSGGQGTGIETCEILSLVPGTHVEVIACCSGRDGSYGLKSEYHDISMKTGQPVVNTIRQVMPDHFGSHCPKAGRQIESSLANGSKAEHPLTLLRKAYGV